MMSPPDPFPPGSFHLWWLAVGVVLLLLTILALHLLNKLFQD